MNQFQRTEALLGCAAMQKLYKSRVAVFGAGGVGGYVLEALARSGIGAIDIIDGDAISLTNLNRQILATYLTLNRYKADVAAERIGEINPDCKATAHRLFFLPETENSIDFTRFDYVVDAIDTVTGKLKIIEKAKLCGVPAISCMGTGNKLDPSAFKVADITKTSVCPLARVMRRELKKRGISDVKVVYSEEPPSAMQTVDCTERVDVAKIADSGLSEKLPPASCAFVPAAAGLLIAAEVIKDLCLKN